MTSRRPSRPLQGAACTRAVVRDAQPVGRRLRTAARVVRLRGARHDQRRARVVARQARRSRSPATSWSRTWRASPRPRACRSTSTANGATPTIQAGSPRPWRMLAEAGAAGFSIEDYDPATGGIDDVGTAAERVAVAAEAAHRLTDPLVLTGRAENHIRGVDDLDDTIARLIAYRDAGADVVYAPGLRRPRADRRRGRRRRRPAERPCAGERPDHRRAGVGRRASRVDRRRAGRGRLRGAARGRARAARRRHLELCAERRAGRRRCEPPLGSRRNRRPSDTSFGASPSRYVVVTDRCARAWHPVRAA